MARTQPQWRIIDQTLDRILGELVQHPAFLARGGGPNVGKVTYQENWDKLDSYARILRRALQSVKDGQNLLWVQTLAAKRIPRAYRYSVNQSLRARQSNLEHVYEKARHLLDLLQEMSGNHALPDLRSLDKLFQQAEEGITALVSDPGHAPEPGIGAPTPTTPAMPFHAVLALIVFYLIHLRNKK